MSHKPNLFIVGAPKCGTTALYSYLKGHPEIFFPANKEPFYFASDLRKERFSCEADYLALFADVCNERIIGEATVWYLYSQEAAAEICRFNSDAKIIIMLRNPVEMIYSLHSHFLYTGLEDIENFSDAVDAESERMQGRMLPAQIRRLQGEDRRVPRALLYREVGRYYRQVKRYLDLFGMEQVQVIVFDDFRADTPNVFRKTLDFLEVDNSYRPDFVPVNVAKEARAGWLRSLTHGRNNTLRDLFRPLIPPQFRQWLVEHLIQFNSRPVRRSAMDAELRSRLQSELLPDVERLSVLLNRDLTHWCRD